MKSRSILISGRGASGDVVEDSGTETFLVLRGPHKGHILTVESAKHNCGAYQEDMCCSCGAEWGSAMTGCWQYSHQRDESGEESLPWSLGADETWAEATKWRIRRWWWQGVILIKRMIYGAEKPAPFNPDLPDLEEEEGDE